MSERRIQVESGVELNVVEDGAGDGMPMLFSNSLATDLHMWDEVIARLPEQGRYIRYDTRGHGASDVPGDGYSLERLGRDALALLDALEIEKVDFVGLSLGGLTGMWLAVYAPDRIGHLVLANTAASFPPPDMWEARARGAIEGGMEQFVEPTLERWFTPQFRQEQSARVAQIAAIVAATTAPGYAGCCHVLAEADILADLPRIAAPTLVIAGAKDPSTPLERAQELTSAIPNANQAVLDAAHLSSVEQPSAFAELLVGAR